MLPCKPYLQYAEFTFPFFGAHCYHTANEAMTDYNELHSLFVCVSLCSFPRSPMHFSNLF